MMLIGKIILVCFGFVSTLGMPYFADSVKNKKFLILLYSMTIVGTGILIVLGWIFGSQLTSSILPAMYSHVGEYMYIFIPAMTLLGWISLILSHISLSSGRLISYLSPIIFV
jgi:hypothetical protein